MSAPTAPANRHGVKVTTTDATPTIVATLQTEADRVYHVYARAVAIETQDHDEAACYTRVAAFYNDGGVLAQISTTEAPFTKETNAAWNCELLAAGTVIQSRVTGAAATTINWRVDLEVLQLT